MLPTEEARNITKLQLSVIIKKIGLKMNINTSLPL